MVIIERLKAMGFKQRVISEASGLHETHISRIRAGFFGITRGSLIALQEAEIVLEKRYKKSQKILDKSGIKT